MAIRTNISPSESNEAEAKFKKHSEQLKKWVKNTKAFSEVFLDAYCVVDILNNVVDFNIAFTEMCGESFRKVLKVGNFCDLIKTEFCPHQCPAKQIITSERSIRLDEITGESKAFPRLRLIIGGIPIFSDEKEIIGALLTIRDVSAEDVLQKKYLERKEESVTDGLTRLYNKVFSEQLLHRFAKMALRDGNSFSVIMCDIDFFKKVNDNFGHQAGDYVLTTISQMLKGEVRGQDVVGRFGGEEFILILPGTDQDGVYAFAERFRKRVEHTEVMFDGQQIPIKLSLGTATYSQSWNSQLKAELIVKELINRADRGLYQAKETGRNRTCQYETLPEEKK